MDMRSAQSGENSKLRRQLSQLLWRLHSLRRCQLPYDELARRLNIVLTEAGSIRQYLKVTLTKPSEGRQPHGLAARVDRDKLRELERGHRGTVTIEKTQQLAADRI